jgi:Flp pilus assembly protein TadB
VILLMVCLALVLAGLVGWPIVRPGAVSRRLARLTGPDAASQAAGEGSLPRSGGVAGGQSGQHGRGAFASRLPHVLIAAASGIGVAVLIGSWWAVPLGVAAGLGAYRFLRSREPADMRAARLRAVADLPLGCDLLAAALKAGAPVDRAVTAVADALGGPLGERLGRVGRSLRLGADPPEAWAHLSDVTGADRVIAAAVRSSDSGGALVGALHRLADDLRADRSVAAGAAARRAGVLIVLPLGLCFLPAFILAGLVPVVVAVLDGVL